MELLHELDNIKLKLHIVSGGISDLIYSSLISVAGKELVDRVISIHSNAWEVYNQDHND